MSELYQLPAGWKWEKLGGFGKFIRGVSYKKEQLLERAEDDSYTLLRANNIQNQLDLTEVQIVPKYVAIGKEIQDGDILFAMSSGSKHLVGKNILLFGLNNYTFGAFCSVYRIEKKSLLNPNYLSYLFTSNLYRDGLSALSMGANIKNLKSSDLEIMDIPVPPLAEQKKIVQKLDVLFERIDKAIALLQKNIDAADNFMNSVLNDVFSDLEQNYPSKDIKSFASVGTGVTPLKTNQTYYDNGTINWITSKSTGEPYVNKADELITVIALNECRLTLNPVGTLIVALYGQGKTRGQVSELMIEAATNQAVATILVDDSKCINKYLKWYFKKSYLELREKSNGGTQQNLNLSIIKSTLVPLPEDLSIQQKIVAYLDEVSAQIEQMKSAQQQKMQNLLELKSSILDQAFHGKL
jgi:type I restriction enzyme S subunit